MKFIASAAFAIEGIAAQELRAMGMDNVTCENNRIYFESDYQGAAKACIWLRSADRVSLLISGFNAQSFDELFDGIATVDWSQYADKKSRICVNARCVRSKLMSQSDVQSISKKAIITALQRRYKVNVFPENGFEVSVLVSLLNNRATVTVDMCGSGLHKRGYRILNSEAPLRETTAAALLMLAGYNKAQTLLDPFCGSGTIAIEGAMMACNIAPGRSRSFLGENYPWCASAFKRQKEAAFDAQKSAEAPILCGDILPQMAEMTQYHAKRADVSNCIKVSCRDACGWDIYDYMGCMVTNPPYGERLLDKRSAFELMHDFSCVTSRLLEQLWSIGILTPQENLEEALFAPCKNRRKIFNSNIQCTYYQFKNNT